MLNGCFGLDQDVFTYWNDRSAAVISLQTDNEHFIRFGQNLITENQRDSPSLLFLFFLIKKNKETEPCRH